MVISVNECARAIELIGAECNVVSTQSEAERAFSEAILKRYPIIIIDEDVSEMISEFKAKMLKDLREPPIIVVIPSFRKPKGLRLSQLYSLISKAVGVKLKWQSQ